MKNKKMLLPAIATLIAGVGIIGLTQTSLAAGMNKKTDRASSSSEVRANRQGQGVGQENRALNEADRLKRQTAVQTAITANDYSAWVTAVGSSSPIASKITKDNFYKLVQAHNLRQQADSLMKELGITQERGQGRGLGLGHVSK